jgi:hypothetical protein
MQNLVNVLLEFSILSVHEDNSKAETKFLSSLRTKMPRLDANFELSSKYTDQFNLYASNHSEPKSVPEDMSSAL